MKLKKKDIDEIIDTNGNLIGMSNIPTFGADLESAANNTTDTNAKIGQQPFRYDMLGRFGFTLMPFMEGEEKNQGQAELENDLVDLMHDRYLDILKYYFRNPKIIKSDYRKHVTDNETSEKTIKHNVEWAGKVLKLIEKHFEKSLKNLDEQFKENLVEGKVAEDRMVKKVEDEMSNRSDDKGVREKKLEKIAGLINKLEQEDIKKLKNLLEIDNG